MSVFDKLAETIAETIKLQDGIDKAARRIAELAGKQEAFFELWEIDGKPGIQEAFDGNFEGLKDRVEELKK